MWQLEDLIVARPATTLAGLRVQAVVGMLHVEKEMAADKKPYLEVKAMRAIRHARPAGGRRLARHHLTDDWGGLRLALSLRQRQGLKTLPRPCSLAAGPTCLP